MMRCSLGPAKAFAVATGVLGALVGCVCVLSRPDEYYVSVLDITPDDLEREGIEAVILDIDNTLLPRTERAIPDNLAAWVASLGEAGIRVCLLTNNWHGRVVEASQQLGCELVTKALKPLPHGFIEARKRLRSKRVNTLVIGDQTLTDILGAHCSGMKALLVTPLATQDLRHTKILRKLDRIFLHGMSPQGGEPAFVADEGDEALL